MNKPEASSCWTRANMATWDERALIHARDATGFYGIERFRKGQDLLLPIESVEIGNVAGKRLLHLQCHLGIDTLCLARRGARVAGLDYSGAAIATAQSLADESRIPATFIRADVYDAAIVLPTGAFDIVYVSWGSLNWLPDIWRWAALVAKLLAPGGHLYLVEQHPFIAALREKDGRLEPGYPWRTPIDHPITTDMPTTYNNDPTPLINRRLHEWDHPLSDIIGALLAAGLRLEFLHEHEVLPWRRFSLMVPAGDRLFRLPADQVAMPLAFSLKASRPA